MKTSWSPEEDLQFSVFGKNGQQLKCFRMVSTHTLGTLRRITSGGLNRLAKTRKHSFRSEVVDKINPDHADALRKAGLAYHILLTMREL